VDVVVCPGCGEENPAKFRLCGFCGTSLAPVPTTIDCPSCGEENPAKFRLCGFCGATLQGGDGGGGTAVATAPAPVAASPVPSAPAEPVQIGAVEVRKPATFIFVDLKGSTALTERIDQEAMSEIKRRYFSVMAAQVERHGGTIEKYIGDAIMAVFGIPRAHEDDALRAVRAAHGMQQELEALNVDFLKFYGVELANRTGVNTGEVVANTDPNANQQLATGDTVNVAARLEQAAPENEILIGETTYDLVRSHVEVEPVEPLELKGKSERVPAYRLVRLRNASETAKAVRAAPLVGRQAEWAQLDAAYQATVSGATTRIATVIGDPGVGKTRLVKEFTDAHEPTATIVSGRCLPYGDGITFWPLAEVARAAADIGDEDPPDQARAKLDALVAPAGGDAGAIADRVASLIGLSSTPFPVRELFWGGRRLLETIAHDRPVIVVVDDLHWAQPTFLDFLVHVAEASTGAPILILATARHVLLEKHADWDARSAGPVLSLGPLSADDAAGLVEHLLGTTGLDPLIRDKVVIAADGNPLFVEQMVSMLVDKGLLRRVDGEWTQSEQGADLAVPPTIQALLASRLDDLSREERAVVEPASVIGLVFFETAIEEMVPGPVRTAVPRHLGSLDDKQFVARDLDDPDEDTYRFRHGLIREATYGSLLKRTRAVMHERFVTWAERVNRERGREQEFEEILGFHLEQSYRYRIELGPLDDVGRDLARRASDKLGRAGERAFLRGDLPAAANLLRRAAAVLAPGDPGRLVLLADAIGALSESGEFDEARKLIEATMADGSVVDGAPGADRVRLAAIDLDLFGEAETMSLDDATARIDVLRDGCSSRTMRAASRGRGGH
jgi:class 3 adenylate cyclase